MTHGNAAARPERKVLALPVVLHDVQRNCIRRESRAGGRQTHRESRDQSRDRQIPFEVRSRNREDVREVVKAAIGGLVARQQRPDVQIDGEKVTDCVVVFSSIQTMNGIDAAGVRIRRPCAIDFGLQPTRHRLIRRRVRPRQAWWRHGAGAKLLDDALPHFRIRARRRHVQTIERKSRGAQPLVMTRNAVGIENGARGRR